MCQRGEEYKEKVYSDIRGHLNSRIIYDHGSTIEEFYDDKGLCGYYLHDNVWVKNAKQFFLEFKDTYKIWGWNNVKDMKCVRLGPKYAASVDNNKNKWEFDF